jgi:hypothetical protein
LNGVDLVQRDGEFLQRHRDGGYSPCYSYTPGGASRAGSDSFGNKAVLFPANDPNFMVATTLAPQVFDAKALRQALGLSEAAGGSIKVCGN